jgi:hypothetical protein
MAKSTELAMAKKKTKPVRDDPDLIRFVDDDGVNYWTRKFGVSRKYLARAVARVGAMMCAIADVFPAFKNARELRIGIDDVLAELKPTHRSMRTSSRRAADQSEAQTPGESRPAGPMSNN